MIISSLRAVLLGAAFFATTAAVAERPVEIFDNNTWSALQSSLPRPAAVVFTATYCESCPQVIAKLDAELTKKHVKAPLIAVVIDGEQESAAVLAEHYAVQRVFVFDGDETALRYGVDPNWRGVTPYVALLSKHGQPVLVTGMPSSKELASWLRQ